MNWGDYFVVDPNSPSGLTWIVDRTCPRGRVVRHLKGLPAGSCGSLPKKGDRPRWKVTLRGKTYFVSRIVYEMLNGYIPEGLIVDHIDGNPLNNRIENLRAVSLTLNGRNKRKYNSNSTGTTGVKFTYNRVSGITYATAQWNVGLESGKTERRCRYFSVDKYGLLPAYALACGLREIMVNISEHGYSGRHGN